MLDEYTRRIKNLYVSSYVFTHFVYIFPPSYVHQICIDSLHGDYFRSIWLENPFNVLRNDYRKRMYQCWISIFFFFALVSKTIKYFGTIKINADSKNRWRVNGNCCLK